ncbi:MAG: (2Fe-2S) ferredoxin domain-containing protein [Myxococcales bacterium]|nr:(2Fe-2S) ferredoxin domain-containing protein [Myxococcota bacterium]MDW8280576.1 (2Fe-2S) ferredoxin domain-containing protein [Myxococcales bacterium]
MRRLQVLICRGPECGQKRRSAEVHAQLLRCLRERPLENVEVELAWQSCFGHCTQGPNVLVRPVLPGENSFRLSMMPALAPGAVLYHGVRPLDVERIVQDYLQRGRSSAERTRNKDPER